MVAWWMIIAGLVAGGTMEVITQRMLSYWSTAIAGSWLRPWGDGGVGYRLRLRIGLLRRRWMALIPLGPAIAVGTLGAVTLSPLGFGPAFAVGFLGLMGLSDWMLLRDGLGKLTQKVAIQAAERLAQQFPIGEVVPILARAAQARDRHVRIAAAWGYGKLPNDIGIKGLQGLLRDSDALVRNASAEAGRSYLMRLDQTTALSLAPLDDHLQRYRKALADAAVEVLAGEGAAKRLREAEAAIDKIVSSQSLLADAAPALYCRRCDRRPLAHSFQEWQWYRCPTCQDALDIAPGIVTVIGVIGGVPSDEPADGILRLVIWDDAHRSVLRADIDVLEIRGGHGIDYDWAVSAVLQDLHARNAATRLRVQLVGQPQLEGNTLRMLQAVDSETINN
jgi:hypothetical protein